MYTHNVDAAKSRKMHEKTKRIIFVFSELNFILSSNEFRFQDYAKSAIKIQAQNSRGKFNSIFILLEKHIFFKW